MSDNPSTPGGSAGGSDRPTVASDTSGDQWWDPPTGGPPPPGGPPPTIGPPPLPDPSLPDPSGPSVSLGRSNKTVLLVVGVAAAVFVTLAGVGLIVFKSLTAPEELTVRKYAAQYCEATEESNKNLVDATEDYFEENADLRDDDGEFARVSDREAERFMELARAYLNAHTALVEEVKGFSDSHRLRGSDGEGLHEDIVQFHEAAIEEFANIESDLNDVDMEDSDDAADDIWKALESDVELIDDSDESAEVYLEAIEEDDECYFPTIYVEGE